MMSRRKLRQHKPAGVPGARRSQVVIAITIALSLSALWTMLASSGSFDSGFRQKARQGKRCRRKAWPTVPHRKNMSTEEAEAAGSSRPKKRPARLLLFTRALTTWPTVRSLRAGRGIKPA
jgi:hypothetical protein